MAAVNALCLVQVFEVGNPRAETAMGMHRSQQVNPTGIPFSRNGGRPLQPALHDRRIPHAGGWIEQVPDAQSWARFSRLARYSHLRLP